MIAYYLKAALPKEEYEVSLEEKIEVERKGKKQTHHVDIFIRKDSKPHFAIEVKTTIGWGRIDVQDEETYKKFIKRIDLIYDKLKVPRENIIYIFVGVNNSGKEFQELYWDKIKKRRLERPTKFPFSMIYPLFDEYDPENHNWPEEMTDEGIKGKLIENLVTPLEDIIKKIRNIP